MGQKNEVSANESESQTENTTSSRGEVSVRGPFGPTSTELHKREHGAAQNTRGALPRGGRDGSTKGFTGQEGAPNHRWGAGAEPWVSVSEWMGGAGGTGNREPTAGLMIFPGKYSDNKQTIISHVMPLTKNS